MDIVLRLGERQRYSALRTKRRAIFHGKTISHSSHYAIIPRARLQFMTMAFGYAPQGSSGMSYCNQTPFPPREGWGLGTRLLTRWPVEGLVKLLRRMTSGRRLEAWHFRSLPRNAITARYNSSLTTTGQSISSNLGEALRVQKAVSATKCAEF